MQGALGCKALNNTCVKSIRVMPAASLISKVKFSPPPVYTTVHFMRCAGVVVFVPMHSNTSCVCFALRSFLIRPPPIPFRTSSPLHPFPAAPLFCGHPSVQNAVLPNKVQWSELFVSPGSNYLEPAPSFCPPF